MFISDKTNQMRKTELSRDNVQWLSHFWKYNVIPTEQEWDKLGGEGYSSRLYMAKGRWKCFTLIRIKNISES